MTNTIEFAPAGHMARDCFQRNGPPGNQFGGPPGIGGAAGAPKSQFDSEYASLMAELGEGGAVGSSGPAIGMITNGSAADGTPAAPKVPPWRVPENWFSNSKPRCTTWSALMTRRSRNSFVMQILDLTWAVVAAALVVVWAEAEADTREATSNSSSSSINSRADTVEVTSNKLRLDTVVKRLPDTEPPLKAVTMPTLPLLGLRRDMVVTRSSSRAWILTHTQRKLKAIREELGNA